LLHRTFWACAFIVCGWGAPVLAAGIQLFNQRPALSGAIWYPCAGEPKHVQLGDLALPVDYALQGVKDCPVAGAKLPLVVFSHGTNGWFGGHHDTAAALADAGFVVAAINHPGDSAKDNARSGELSVFVSRPADMIRLIDFVLNDWKDKSVVDAVGSVCSGFPWADIPASH
jgi:predicted dienelactone hydrolase